MSKELEALEQLKYYNTISNDDFDMTNELSIIETALKNYQELLERPCVLVGRKHGHTKALIDVISKNYKEIKIISLEDEKKLKALEIIKEKRVNVFWLMECISCYTNALEKYNEEVLCKDIDCLTQEEFDLIKEVLL